MLRSPTPVSIWSELAHATRHALARRPAAARTFVNHAPRRTTAGSDSASTTQESSLQSSTSKLLEATAAELAKAAKNRSTDGYASYGARNKQAVEQISRNINGTTSVRSRKTTTTPPPPSSTPESIWRLGQFVNYTDPVTTTSARSFDCTPSTLAQNYRLLTRTLNENNVRRELRKQERFESKSDKRVRLNSERHRRRFKVAVGKAVSLAMRNKDK
ncbi:hypothetical protein OIV83_002592 [Microbotryomycetes sp. JL201]|nr:hypothetical protein OIV83_002592 [Microbotryomycetes sp. JL201]